MIQFVLLIIVTLFTSLIVDFPTACLVSVAFILGKGISFGIGGNFRKKAAKMYGILFLAGWVYMLMCYFYMTQNGYDWLLAYDTYNYFIPITEKYISSGNGNLWSIYQNIFENYDFFGRNQYFYWIYTCTWGVIIHSIGGTIYFGLQASTLFIYGFVGVVLEKIFRNYGFDPEKSYKHALAICFLSIIFFYSSQILRDIHVLLCYLVAIYLSGKPKFSIRVIIELSVVVFLTCGIRIESGLFLFLIIPAYLLSIQSKKNRFYVITVSVLILLVFIVWFANNRNLLFGIFAANAEVYTEGIDEGTGVIAFFQRIPILGDFLSIIYNASQPIPVWSRLDPANNLQYGGNASNIMNYPKILSAFFNVMTYIYIFAWLFNKKIREKALVTKAHKIQLLIGLVFLYIQSAVVEQRRLLGYYCVFYILMFLIHDALNNKERKTINTVVVSVFAVLQLIGLLFFA